MAKIFIEETTLTAIADAIRNKTGKSELIDPANMSTEIANIVAGGGGGIEIDPIVLTGDCSYGCTGTIAATFVTLFPDKVSTESMSKADNLFLNSTLTSIPFDLNFTTACSSIAYLFKGCTNLLDIPDMTLNNTSNLEMSQIFYNCRQLREPPYFHGARPNVISGLFYNCNNIRYIPDDYFEDWDNSRLTTYNYGGGGNVFTGCYSLRKVPTSFFELCFDSLATSAANCIYYSCFSLCKSLSEVVGLPVVSATLTSDRLGSTFDGCSRLKTATFKTNDDGTPKSAQWKSQILNLSNNVGFATVDVTYITNYNSGIAAAKEVKDDATYQALKNDPDWFTTKFEYSRYNHDSAVETINSLPDTSAYGTNTIKFKGIAGSATDGGAIENLTAEEIAVAAAKGWTVTLS